jgi:hypothetical protein
VDRIRRAGKLKIDSLGNFPSEQLKRSESYPVAWNPLVVHEPAETRETLSKAAGDKFSHAELDNFSDLIARRTSGSRG